jgi:hypothetical protein
MVGTTGDNNSITGRSYPVIGHEPWRLVLPALLFARRGAPTAHVLHPGSVRQCPINDLHGSFPRCRIRLAFQKLAYGVLKGCGVCPLCSSFGLLAGELRFKFGPQLCSSFPGSGDARRMI